MNKCENCIEWEYFEGYGYGCFYKQTMTPIDADKCDSFVNKKDKKIKGDKTMFYKIVRHSEYDTQDTQLADASEIIAVCMAVDKSTAAITFNIYESANVCHIPQDIRRNFIRSIEEATQDEYLDYMRNVY